MCTLAPYLCVNLIGCSLIRNIKKLFLQTGKTTKEEKIKSKE